MALRRAIHAQGFRYKLHVKGYAGKPDLLLPKFNAAIFVHGCFWHRHEGCRYTTTPSTRAEFWHAKFEVNVARDSAVRTTLLENGWRVATVWECALRKPELVQLAANLLAAWLRGDAPELEFGETDLTAVEHGECVVSLQKEE